MPTAPPAYHKVAPLLDLHQSTSGSCPFPKYRSPQVSLDLDFNLPFSSAVPVSSKLLKRDMGQYLLPVKWLLLISSYTCKDAYNV